MKQSWIIIGTLVTLTCWADDNVVKKSISIDDGYASTRYFYYDSLNRPTFMEEYDADGQLGARYTYSYDGLTEIRYNYEGSRYLGGEVTVYLDSAHTLKKQVYLLTDRAYMEDTTDYEYDSHHRLISRQHKNYSGVYEQVTYTYLPFKQKARVIYPKLSDSPFTLTTTYCDSKRERVKCETYVENGVRHKVTYRYDGQGRLIEWAEYENNCVLQRITHTYVGDREIIYNTHGGIIINYY